ncbi:dehydrogenase/reductase SDR family member 1 [Bubalus kerabau]|uniref:dehydrogenase/reductase SDR family member 1 n=1 Tax=Bubalus carabanensis TaxID=3119969 RepID=UPI00244E7D79|nr:dehydrogenase/reductase SDR family member 1 [Bubalus carabanensis]
MPATMKGQVCVVTGASRGIGRGIALQLCQAGATVYITGRHLDTLQATAQEAQSQGGRCVPVVCDSSQESEVRNLFEQVDREQQRRLDVLVNNAYAGVQPILNNSKKSFWENPASIWDDINNVGLSRSVRKTECQPSSPYPPHSRPTGKSVPGCDRMAADCAQELRCHGVSYVSLWPGLVQTELLKEHMMKENASDPLTKQFKFFFSSAETTEMSGKCVVALATDPNILSLSGKVLPSCDLARRYGLQDVDGRPVQDYLSLSSALSHVSNLGWLASYLPGFLWVPKWVLTLYASKF